MHLGNLAFSLYKAKLHAFFATFEIWPKELEADHNRYYAERQTPPSERPQPAWPTMRTNV